MPQYEFRVIPAPRQGLKAKGLRSTEDRFAHAVEVQMNDMAAHGWEFLRSETLPCDERVGLTGRQTVFQTMLVFRREAEAAAARPRMPMLAAPVEAAPEVRTDTVIRPAPTVGPATPPPLHDGTRVAAE